MKELKEVRFNEQNIQLQDNVVKGSILPEKIAELGRTITVKGDTVVEGPVFASKLTVENGSLDIHGAVFTQIELYVNTDATGDITFRHSVGSADSVTSRGRNCKLVFHSDINAKSVALCNAFVAGSIYADDIVLENCVVIGGVFAAQELSLNNSVVGTFNAPIVNIAQTVSLLLPSAFSMEPIIAEPGARLLNLSLADLGALFRGVPQSPTSGYIEMSLSDDEVKTHLINEEVQKTIRSYTVVGKVLAVDLLDTDKFQNHFLLSAVGLSSQLLKTYDLGPDKDGNPATLSFDRLYAFFFDLMAGKLDIQPISGKFSISQFAEKYK